MNVLDDPVMSEYVTSLGNRLLAHADGVNFPFEFFMVRNNTLNASAFLGGKVAINTGLFNYAKTEDEFASVIAHEISHVTQRHIARFVELATASSRLSTAGIIGAVAMSIINLLSVWQPWLRLWVHKCKAASTSLVIMSMRPIV